MSKINDWFIGMQEDAAWMTRNEFVDRYGTANIAVWDEVTGFGWDELESDYMEMDDGA